MAEVPSHMRGAEIEAERSNPTIRSKFDKSHGKGLPAPHLSFPGQVAPQTNPAPSVRMEPKEVGSRGAYKTTHIPPSNLGTAMAEGRRTAGAPNMGQTATVGKSSSVGQSGMARGESGTPYGRDPVKSSTQHDTRSANPRMGTQVKSATKSGASDNVVKRGSTKQGPGVLAGAKRT